MCVLLPQSSRPVRAVGLAAPGSVAGSVGIPVSSCICTFVCLDCWVGGVLDWCCSNNQDPKGQTQVEQLASRGPLQNLLLAGSVDWCTVLRGSRLVLTLLAYSSCVQQLWPHFVSVLLSPVYVAPHSFSPVFLSSSLVCLLPFFLIHFAVAALVSLRCTCGCMCSSLSYMWLLLCLFVIHAAELWYMLLRCF